MFTTISQDGRGKQGNDGPQRIPSWVSNLLDILARTPGSSVISTTAKAGGSNVHKQFGEEGGAGMLTETPSWGVPESIFILWLHPSTGQGY